MRKVLAIGLILAVSALFTAFVIKSPTPATSELDWLSWDEMVTAHQQQPKKVLIDVYTDWCGWCKRMDATTFVDPAVVSYLREHFYVVKFDAEQKTDIQYRGHTLQFDATNGRRGSHELAVALLNGRMSYPSIVYLDENLDRITISPGYKPADNLLNELEFVADEHYKERSWEEFVESKE